MSKGERALASRAGRTRFTLTPVSRTDASSSPTLRLQEVMACLQRDPSPVTAPKVPLESMQSEVIVKSVVAMMCASHIVQDKAS